MRSLLLYPLICLVALFIVHCSAKQRRSNNGGRSKNNSGDSSRPNIVIILADDLGYGDLQCYGHPTSQTPNIDLLANRGTKMTAMYTASPLCSPSRAGLLTGRYPPRTGIWPGVFGPASTGGLQSEEFTIAELLKSNGLNYSTAIVGKWHLGTGGEDGTYLPMNQGFDFWTGIPYSHDMPLPPVCFPTDLPCYPSTPLDPWYSEIKDSTNPTRFDDNHYYQVLNRTTYKPDHKKRRREWKDLFNDMGTDKIGGISAADVENYIREHDLKLPIDEIDYQLWAHADSDVMTALDNLWAERGGSRFDFPITTTVKTPLPLYRNFEIVQQPVYMPDVPAYYLDTAQEFIKNSTDEGKPFFLYFAPHETHHPQFSSEMFFNTSQRGSFGDALSELDHTVGALISYLNEVGVADNTLVFFFSDNGASLYIQSGYGNSGHLKCGKATSWEGGPRVPGIAYWPGQIPAGRTTRQIGSLLDVLPTLSDLLDVPLPSDRTYDGVSMKEWLFNPEGKSKRHTYYYWPGQTNNGTGEWTQSLRAVRTNQYKLMWHTGGGVGQDTLADPDCRHNNTGILLDTPLLFNLYQDPSEMWPLNLTDRYYDDIIKDLNNTFNEILDEPDLWAASETHKNTDTNYEPCCNWGCSPWPDCCVCDKLSNYW